MRTPPLCWGLTCSDVPPHFSVVVIDADGHRIPWPDASHIDDDAMCELMRQIVNRVFTFQTRAEEPGFLDRLGPWMEVASRWDEPKLDASFLRTRLASVEPWGRRSGVDGGGICNEHSRRHIRTMDRKSSRLGVERRRARNAHQTGGTIPSDSAGSCRRGRERRRRNRDLDPPRVPSPRPGRSTYSVDQFVRSPGAATGPALGDGPNRLRLHAGTPRRV